MFRSLFISPPCAKGFLALDGEGSYSFQFDVSALLGVLLSEIFWLSFDISWFFIRISRLNDLISIRILLLMLDEFPIREDMDKSWFLFNIYVGTMLKFIHL